MSNKRKLAEELFCQTNNPYCKEARISFTRLSNGNRNPLTGSVAEMFDHYSYPMSNSFQKAFINILEYLPTQNGSLYCIQGYVWNYLTNYTAHHKAGDRAKMRTGNENIDNIIQYLEYLYDTDPDSRFEH